MQVQYEGYIKTWLDEGWMALCYLINLIQWITASAYPLDMAYLIY